MSSISVCERYGKAYANEYNKFLGITNPKGKLANIVGVALLIATFATSAFGLAGVIPTSLTGWIVTGLGGGYAGVKLLAGNLVARKKDLASSLPTCALILVLGILAGLGVLSAPPACGALMGGAVIVPLIITVGLMVYLHLTAPKREPKLNETR